MRLEVGFHKDAVEGSPAAKGPPKRLRVNAMGETISKQN